jgi:transporter family protein
MTTLALVARIILLGFERIIVKKMGRNNGSIEVTILFFGFGTLCLLPFLVGMELPGPGYLIYPLISSLIYSVTFVLYVRALSLGDVSLVTPVSSFNVLFLFILSVIFLGEHFSLVKLTGILMIFYGSSFLKPGSNPLVSLKEIFQDKSCLYMLLSTLLLAVGRIIDKAASSKVSAILYSFTIYTLITFFLLTYLLIRGNIKNLKVVFKKHPYISVLSGSINAFSYLFLLVALKEIEVSVAEPLTLLSTLLAVILGRIFFQEVIKQRLIAAVIIILGSWLILL